MVRRRQELVHSAATTIQAFFFRSFMLLNWRALVAAVLLDAHTSATKIQCLARCHLARRRLSRLRGAYRFGRDFSAGSELGNWQSFGLLLGVGRGDQGTCESSTSPPPSHIHTWRVRTETRPSVATIMDILQFPPPPPGCVSLDSGDSSSSWSSVRMAAGASGSSSGGFGLHQRGLNQAVSDAAFQDTDAKCAVARQFVSGALCAQIERGGLLAGKDVADRLRQLVGALQNGRDAE